MLKGVLDPHLSISAPDEPVVRDIYCSCSNNSIYMLTFQPKFRPTMERVSQEFLFHKATLVKPFHEISISQLWKQELIYLNEGFFYFLEVVSLIPLVLQIPWDEVQK